MNLKLSSEKNGNESQNEVENEVENQAGTGPKFDFRNKQKTEGKMIRK